MEGKTMQRPTTVNQIESQKPNAPRSENILTGYIANSMNGGINKTIAYKKVMAGERHKEYRIQAKFQMLTPLTPTYQNLRCTVRAFFVPNSRVWDNAEEYTAQRGGASVEKITELPNFGGKQFPILPTGTATATKGTLLTSTEIWRDSFIAPYFPARIFTAEQGLRIDSNQDITYSNPLPKISALPVRGRIAIYNDFERNKEYDPEVTEYKTDTVSAQEWASYLPYQDAEANWDFYTMRARRQNNYYTDYRTELQGLDEVAPTLASDATALTDWIKWENLLAESRSETNNAQKNDWDIISEIRGSKKLTEGKVQLIGQKTFNLNYAAITQNAYSSDETIDDRFRVLGKQGAYSYTEINESIYAGMVFNEEGYVHIIATVQADTVFETGIDRNLLNVTPLDEYRPDLIDQKEDVLYKIETDTVYGVGGTNLNAMEVTGFKRKFSEYFRLPSTVGGDMSSYNTYQNARNENSWFVDKKLGNGNATIGNDTFQFFEQGMYTENIRGKIMRKKPWLDYSDFMINKNQAIENQVELYRNNQNVKTQSGRILGQNQIFFVGICNLVADLPINEEIKHNYTTWGEH